MTHLKRLYGKVHEVLRRGVLTQGPFVPEVALTFDDGPNPEWTPQVLDILDANRAKATFFVLGEQVAEHPELARQAVGRGHELASHLFSHDRTAADDPARFHDEMKKTAELISDITGKAPRFVRFPFAYTGRQRPKHIKKTYDMDAVHWSFSGMDSRLDSADIVSRIHRLLYPGAIVLLHDGIGRFSKFVKHRKATVDALPEILECSHGMGLEPVTLSTLMAASQTRFST